MQLGSRKSFDARLRAVLDPQRQRSVIRTMAARCRDSVTGAFKSPRPQ